MTVSLQRLSQITDEVFHLIKKDNFSDVGDRLPAFSISLLDIRLQSLMQTRNMYSTEELALYLKVSSGVRCFLPTWQPLLNATIELAKINGENVNHLRYSVKVTNLPRFAI